MIVMTTPAEMTSHCEPYGPLKSNSVVEIGRRSFEGR